MLVETTACQSWRVFLRHSLYCENISISHTSMLLRRCVVNISVCQFCLLLFYGQSILCYLLLFTRPYYMLFCRGKWVGPANLASRDQRFVVIIIIIIIIRSSGCMNFLIA